MGQRGRKPDQEDVAMNRIGVYYAFLAQSDSVDWHDCLDRAARAGADALEVSAPKLHLLPKDQRTSIAQHARDLGFSLTMATALPPDADISSDDEHVHEGGVEHLLRDIQLATEMGVEVIGGILTGPSKHFPAGIEYTRWKALENCIRGLSRIVASARMANVIIGLEVANRFETPLVNTALDALKVIEAVNDPVVGIHLDTFHMNIEEKNPADAIRLAGKHLVHFHVCENNRALPGQAHILWGDIFRALRDTAYKGSIVIESLPGPYGSIASRLNIWRRLSEDVDKELAISIRFLREWIKEGNAVE